MLILVALVCLLFGASTGLLLGAILAHRHYQYPGEHRAGTLRAVPGDNPL